MQSIRKLLPFVKPYWKQSLWALFLLTAIVFMDLAIPRLIQRIIDVGIGEQNSQVVLQTSILMLCISALSALFALGNNYYSIQAGESVARDLRQALFIKIQQLSFGNLDRLTTGNLMVRLTSDTSAVQRLVQVSLRIGTRAPLLMIGSLVLIFITDSRLALKLLPLLLVTSVLIVFFVVKMEPLFLSVQKKLDRLNTVLQENIAGVRVVKAFDRAAYESGRFETSNQDLAEHTTRVMQFMASMSPALTICVNIGIVIVIWAGGLQTIQEELSVGQIVALTNYLMTTMTPLILMTMLSNVLAAGVASTGRIQEVLDMEPDIQQAENTAALPEALNGRVVFENVSFHYSDGSDGTVLEGINLVAEPGETVAVLGATGAGKSTLVNLIPRFYDVTSGRILLDGVDIRQLEQEALLSHIGIVPQETILFSGSVKENIRYGGPQASDEDVVAAAKAAQAHDFILELPQGYDTHIEERGVNLSGGQKQRIAIARALLVQPNILILDDSTSSVDLETEAKIQAALDKRTKQQTRFVVAQRISTVLNADKIIVLDKGRLAAQGRHRELMQSSPIYQEIYDSQLGNGFRLEGAAQEIVEGAH